MDNNDVIFKNQQAMNRVLVDICKRQKKAIKKLSIFGVISFSAFVILLTICLFCL